MAESKTEEYRQRYFAAAHAMQTGVAAKMNFDPSETTPKHLRVGVNAAMSDAGGLVGLLISKGVITEEEYMKAICEQMEAERDKYQEEIQAHYPGAKITLA